MKVDLWKSVAINVYEATEPATIRWVEIVWQQADTQVRKNERFFICMN